MAEQFFASGPAGRLSARRYPSSNPAAEPLLLIMGVGGHHRMWGRDFLARLSQHFDVATLDNRGIGESHRADADFTLDDLAADALAVLDELGWERAHVHGLSMGGTIAQVLTLRAPDRVRTLSLGGTWGGPMPDDTSVWGDSIMKLAEAASGGVEPLRAAELMFSANVSSACAGDPSAFERFTQDAAAEKVPAAVIMMQMRAATAHDVMDQLGGLSCPTLVIHGDADEVIRPEAGAALAEAIPQAELHWCPGIGHLFCWEDGSTAEPIIEFIRRATA